MINVSFSGTADDVFTEMRAFLGMDSAVASAEPPSPPEPPKKCGRKAKEGPAKEDPAPAVEQPIEEAEIVEADKEPGVEDVKAAIKAFYAAAGENPTFALLQEFGCKNASGVFEAGKGAEFIARCKAAAVLQADGTKTSVIEADGTKTSE